MAANGTTIRIRKRDYVKRSMIVAVSALIIWVGGVNACVTFPPIETPDIEKAARTADIVAVIHVDRVDWRTPQEGAEFERLWAHPPMDTPFSFPARSVWFSVKRIFKGHITADTLLRSGSTSCEFALEAGQDYVLFADLPSDDDRIVPWRSTFPLDATRYSAARLADVESLFTHSNSPSP